MKQQLVTQYGYKREIELPFADTVTKVKEELSKEGFGILTEIDVQATLKKKLNVDYDNYIILGACNPPFAYEALKAEKEIGLFLPCNVIVYMDEGRTFVSAVLPTIAMGTIGNSTLSGIANTVEEKLKKVVDSI